MSAIKGFLKWCSLLVLAPLTFIGLFGVLLVDWVLAELASLVCRKKVKSGYEEMLEQWELHHDD